MSNRDLHIAIGGVITGIWLEYFILRIFGLLP
jgi:hypothetical protein